LKGTILLPEKDDFKKLVLLFMDLVPQDRDETIYENKPFKDMAEVYRKELHPIDLIKGH
jgi:hypothetical protein